MIRKEIAEISQLESRQMNNDRAPPGQTTSLIEDESIVEIVEMLQNSQTCLDQEAGTESDVTVTDIRLEHHVTETDHQHTDHIVFDSVEDDDIQERDFKLNYLPLVGWSKIYPKLHEYFEICPPPSSQQN